MCDCVSLPLYYAFTLVAGMSTKKPPVLEEEGDYEDWKREIDETNNGNNAKNTTKQFYLCILLTFLLGTIVRP